MAERRSALLAIAVRTRAGIEIPTGADRYGACDVDGPKRCKCLRACPIGMQPAAVETGTKQCRHAEYRPRNAQARLCTPISKPRQFCFRDEIGPIGIVLAALRHLLPLQPDERSMTC